MSDLMRPINLWLTLESIMLRRFYLNFLAGLIALSVVGAYSSALGEERIEDFTYEAIDPLNLLIDKLDSDLERENQRALVRDAIVNSLRHGKLAEAQQKAEQYSFSAPTPELRAKWLALANRLKTKVAEQEVDTKRRLEAFYARLPEVFHATSPEEMDQVLAILTGPPLRLEQEELDRLNTARSAAARWQLMLRAQAAGDAQAALKAVEFLDSRNLPIESARLTAVRSDLGKQARKALTEKVHSELRHIMAAASPEDAASNLVRASSIRTRLLPQLRQGTAEYEIISNIAPFASSWQQLCEQREQGQHAAVADIANNLLNAGYPVLEEEIRAIRDDARGKATNAIKRFIAESKQSLIEAETTDQFLNACGRLKNTRVADISSTDTPGFHDASALVKLAWPLFEAASHLQKKEYVAAQDRFNQLLKTPIDDDLKERITLLSDASQQAMRSAVSGILREGKERLSNCKQASEARLASEWIRRHNLSTLATPSTPKYAQVPVLSSIAAAWEKLLAAGEKGAVGTYQSLVTELEQLKPQLDADDQAWFTEQFQDIIDDSRRKAASLRETHRKQIDARIAEVEAGNNYEALLEGLQSEQYRNDRSPLGDDIANFAKELEILVELQASMERDGLDRVREFMSRRIEMVQHPWSEWADGMERDMILRQLSAASQFDPLVARPGESLQAVLLRTADAAVEKQEWSTVVRLLEAYRATFGADYWVSEEISGCSAFHQALLLERAGDIMAARRAYVQVLGYNAARVPHQQAEARLAALRQQYPKVFEQPLPPEVK